MYGKDGADEVSAWVLGLRGNVAFHNYEIVEKWKSGTRVGHTVMGSREVEGSRGADALENIGVN